MALYSRRWEPEACQGPHKLRGAPRGVGRAPQACGFLVGPLLVFVLPIFFIYSKIILRKFSGHLELCRIAISISPLSGPEFQLPAISLFM